MNLIERYVLAVTESLPSDMKTDVAEELRSNIEDMLPDSPTEADIRTALEKLGNPRTLAQEYSPVKKYLIGPAFYDTYISILKLVTGIVAAVIAGLTLVDLALNWAQKNPESLYSTSQYASFISSMITVIITDVIAAVINAVFMAAFWVTLIFAVMERMNQGRLPFEKKDWTLEDLPTEPVSAKSKISRGESAVSLFFTILFTALIYFKPELIALYTTKDGSFSPFPLLSPERLKFYIPVILILALVQLLIIVWKFIQGRWTLPLAIANALDNGASCILVILLINDRALINQDFIREITSLLELSQTGLFNSWLWVTVMITLVIFIGVSLWDSVLGFVRSKK